MSNATPLAYTFSGANVSGTTQIGALTVGFPSTGFTNTPQFWNGPDENLGYVIGHQDPSGSHSGNTQSGDIPAFLGFFRSPLLTENSFVEYVNSVFNQSFTGGTQAKVWLNNNGYWTSYKDVYRYDPATFLSWPASTAGYTLYTGGFTVNDDGNSNLPITLPVPFETNNQSSSSLFLSTNGYFTLTSGIGTIISTPQQIPNPAAMCGNPGDNWMQPGVTLTDGDVQNWWYQTGTDGGGKFYAKLLVYQGQYQNITRPLSYVINFYRDEQYEWLETRIKLNSSGGNAGPYNATDVSQGASTTSRVWRGDLNGQNWVYMGTGTVQI